MGFPKIPDSAEIAAMTKEAMEPMANDIAEIKESLRTLVDLQRQQLSALTAVLSQTNTRPIRKAG